MPGAIKEAIVAFILSLRSTHKLGFVHCSPWSGPPLQSVVNKPLPLSNPKGKHHRSGSVGRKSVECHGQILLTYNEVKFVHSLRME